MARSALGRRPDASQRIATLALRYELPPRAAEQLVSLLRIIELDPFAPTTIRDPAKAIDDHLADSLVALRCEQARIVGTIADLGTGAGFPGLPLAIARPDAAVSLVESSVRKCAFVRRAVTACGLENVYVIHARAEQWPEARAAFDLVTARALASLAVVAEYAAPLLCIGGALIAWRGRRDRAGERAGAIAAGQLGLEAREPVRVEPYEGAERRYLQVMVKVSETPARFPRRPGMARKHPLGASPGRAREAGSRTDGRSSETGEAWGL